MRRKWKNVCIGMACFVLFLTALLPVDVSAKEQTTLQMMKIVENTQLFEQPEEDASIVIELEKGAIVTVQDKVDENWSLVQYQQNSGYVHNAVLVSLKEDGTLDKEFDWVYNDDMLWYSEIMEALKQERSAKIWGGCIVALVVAIFAIGIVSAIKSNKDNTETVNEEEEINSNAEDVKNT